MKNRRSMRHRFPPEAPFRASNTPSPQNIRQRLTQLADHAQEQQLSATEMIELLRQEAENIQRQSWETC
ncbi:hypothetical protein Dd703_2084 [Musicola paradisiaca Ech703]|uniref:DUF2732 family protein n=2 Tax=Musicola paradisiaca TaxID=69223 RepID=C6C6X7_MUSP7|nr:hypothetical protein Dd703_2084 [Musicola paradisiaca Ech703]